MLYNFFIELKTLRLQILIAKQKLAKFAENI